MEWGYYDESDGKYYVIMANGQKRPATSAEASSIGTGGGWVQIGMPTQPDLGALAEQQAPGLTTSRSADPAGGGPSFTPGINFGTGVLPGQGQNGQQYQRQWFDVGGDPNNESLNNIYYNSNWDEAWDKVLNQFGGMPGSDFYDFLQGFSQKAQTEYNNLAPYGGAGINVADFIDAYAPQIKGVYDLIPGSRKGQRGTALTLRAQY